ncbi:hypothetical protein GCK32_018738 [Trichostrongylus colubriformis]|uniref:Uncharacterized protein n=1 Tax=Trichostrongylus colubriformis TaxID=6319 RepID=A0AAN8G8K8_TRICO
MLNGRILLFALIFLLCLLSTVSSKHTKSHRKKPKKTTAQEPCLKGWYGCKRHCYLKYRLYRAACFDGKCECSFD